VRLARAKIVLRKAASTHFGGERQPCRVPIAAEEPNGYAEKGRQIETIGKTPKTP
jgi:hypothetical protein